MSAVVGAIGRDRRTFIGGSDIGAIVGVDPWKTALDVWREKVGQAPPFEGNADTQRGTTLEPVAADEYGKRFGVKLRRVNRPLVHPEYGFLSAQVDRRETGSTTIVEIKCPRLGAFSKIKREGLDLAKICQLQWQLGLDAAADHAEERVGHWWVFCADLWDGLRPAVPHDSQVFAGLVERAVHFWHEHVLTNVPPTDKQSAELAMEIRAAEQAGLVRRDDEAFQIAMGLLREAKTLASEAEVLEQQAKDRVRELIDGQPGLYLAPGARLSYTMAKGRASFDKKALIANRPLDRLKVGVALMEAFADAPPGSLLEQAIARVGDCDLDLAAFESTGKPYPVLKATFFEGD